MLIEGSANKNNELYAVDEVEGHDNLDLEVARCVDRKNKSTSYPQNVTMLSLSNPILGRRMRTQLSRKDAKYFLCRQNKIL